MELNEALAQVTEIRAHLARTEPFRGFRSVTVASSAAVAAVAGVLQSLLISDAAEQIERYIVLWVSAALVCVLVAGSALASRVRNSANSFERAKTIQAIEQFAPCLLAGAIVTGVVYMRTPDSCWMLPGLWAILFSMGVFACYRLIDSTIFVAAGYYLLVGMALLAARPEITFSPWTMPVAFGGGQLLTAALLYWRLERQHG